MTEEQVLAFSEEKFRLLATWDARWRNIPDGASCCLCGYSNPFTLVGAGQIVFCQSCVQEIWGKSRTQRQHLGRRPTPVSTTPPTDANEQLLLTDLQRLWIAAGFKPGSWFAIGFDIGAYIVICAEWME